MIIGFTFERIDVIEISTNCSSHKHLKRKKRKRERKRKRKREKERERERHIIIFRLLAFFWFNIFVCKR